MGNKSLKIVLKNDRVERVEEAMVKIGKAVNDNICRLGADMLKTHKMLEIIYDQTPAGMWERFKRWIGGKK